MHGQDERKHVTAMQIYSLKKKKKLPKANKQKTPVTRKGTRETKCNLKNVTQSIGKM